MSTAKGNADEALRQGFRYLNRWTLLNWRLGLGPYISLWPQVMGRYVVLVHTGRKSGLQRQTPVNYAEIDGDVYVVAGFGKGSDWYKNILAKPQIEMWLPDGWWQAEAEPVSDDDPQWLAILREVLKGSGFAAYLAGVNPQTMTDEALKQATEGYCLLRLRRVAPRTGQGGPGDLVWIWPLLVALLLPRALCRRR